MKAWIYPTFVFWVMASDAHAHAFLARSEPAVGTSVATAPKALRLDFTEPVELPLSGIEVAGASGARLMLGRLRYADNTNKSLAVDLPSLAPGNYRVTWHVVSSDTHRTEGDFAFSVK